MNASQVAFKHFETPDEIREFPKERFELVTIGGVTVGRATYEPGWKWSDQDRYGVRSVNV